MAYNELKAKGTITSQVGKGYFIQNETTEFRHNVLLVFDRLTAYKEELYDSFKNALKKDGSEQIYFHHNNIKMFQTILKEAYGEFTEYVIMPIDHPEALQMIGKLPSNKVYILDQGLTRYKDIYTYVCQDFERDIFNILKNNAHLVGKYKRIILVIRQQKSHFGDIIKGFSDFCKQHPISYKVVKEINSFRIKPKDAFIVVDDHDLDYLVRYSIEKQMIWGADMGIISYNETPLKGIIASGITTISTDFALMGKSIAEMILSGIWIKKVNPFIMYERKSF
jgi:DNA-binding LacI/PurR family transcriptional regulator